MIRFLAAFEQEEEIMKHLYNIGLAVIVIVLFFGTASAQKKTTKKTTARKTTTAAPKTTVPPLDVRAGREKVQIQLDNLNAFLNVFGPLAQDMETADADVKAGRLKGPTVEKVETAKAQIVQTIRNMKTGFTNLESEFRTKAALKQYLSHIEGITDLSLQSEDSAIAGKFVAAKDPLREIVKKLTDTLAVLPK